MISSTKTRVAAIALNALASTTMAAPGSRSSSRSSSTSTARTGRYDCPTTAPASSRAPGPRLARAVPSRCGPSPRTRLVRTTSLAGPVTRRPARPALDGSPSRSPRHPRHPRGALLRGGAPRDLLLWGSARIRLGDQVVRRQPRARRSELRRTTRADVRLLWRQWGRQDDHDADRPRPGPRRPGGGALERPDSRPGNPPPDRVHARGTRPLSPRCVPSINSATSGCCTA